MAMPLSARASDKYDVIIVDSTDPEGPGEILFTTEFYKRCKDRLTPGGVLVTQNGVPFMQPEELRSSATHLRNFFADVSCYLATIPTYVGGAMAMGWATDNAALAQGDGGNAGGALQTVKAEQPLLYAGSAQGRVCLAALCGGIAGLVRGGCILAQPFRRSQGDRVKPRTARIQMFGKLRPHARIPELADVVFNACNGFFFRIGFEKIRNLVGHMDKMFDIHD